MDCIPWARIVRDYKDFNALFHVLWWIDGTGGMGGFSSAKKSDPSKEGEAPRRAALPSYSTIIKHPEGYVTRGSHQGVYWSSGIECICPN